MAVTVDPNFRGSTDQTDLTQLGNDGSALPSGIPLAPNPSITPIEAFALQPGTFDILQNPNSPLRQFQPDSGDINPEQAVSGDDLKVGDEGPAVEVLQQRLKDLGYTQVGTVDGNFGPNTLSAVQAFQDDQIAALQSRVDNAPSVQEANRFQAQLNNLQSDRDAGIVGTQTRAELNNPTEPVATDNTSADSTTAGDTSTDATAEDENGLQDIIPDISSRSEEEKQQILGAVDQLENGTPSERLSAAITLANLVDRDQLDRIATELGVRDASITRLLNSPAAFAAAATVADPNASDAERINATIDLAEAVGSLPRGELGDALEPHLKSLAQAQSLAHLVNTIFDPNASAQDKAEAALDFAGDLRKGNPLLSNRVNALLGTTGNVTAVLSAALTLTDPEASVAEKAGAVVDLAAALPKLKGDITAIRDLLKNYVGSADLEKLLRELPAEIRLSPRIVAALDPDVLQSLSKADIDNLEKLTKSYIKATGDESLEQLTDVLAKLDAGDLRKFVKLANNFDGRQLDLIVKMFDGIDGRLLRTTLGALDEVSGTHLKRLNEILKPLIGLLDKVGVEITADVATRLAKGIGKLIPVLGAAVAAYDAFGQLQKVADTEGLPPELRFLAFTGARVNTADAIYSILEPLIAAGTGGLGIAPDIALAAGGLFIDLVLAHEESKLAEQGDNYEAPDWIGHANVASALTDPAGLAAFYGIYGVEEGNKEIANTLNAGGQFALDQADALIALVDQNLPAARDLAVDLLLTGGTPGILLTNAIGIDPSEGARLVIDALGDAGEAGKEALTRLKDAGINYAGQVLQSLLNSFLGLFQS